MSSQHSLKVSCHCHAIKQYVPDRYNEPYAYNPRLPEESVKEVDLCHCTSCRRATGLLYTSYFPTMEPDRKSLSAMTAYPALPKKHTFTRLSRRWFCSKCGCHLFRSSVDPKRAEIHAAHVRDKGFFFRECGCRVCVENCVSGQPGHGGSSPDPRERQTPYFYGRLGGEETTWTVAMGALSAIAGFVCFRDHIHVADLKDGGAASWLQETNFNSLQTFSGAGISYYTGKEDSSKIAIQYQSTHSSPVSADVLQASCLCGKIKFHITRPDASSDSSEAKIPKFLPENIEETHKPWWLWENKTKYLAGLCSCRSCRLTSGFEIQPWAFIPQFNIFLDPPTTGANSQGPSSTENISDNLRVYQSSPGIFRDFCATCGATCFLHENKNPGLVRVSVGLFNAIEGARAENWLKWWTKGIGFEEDAEEERPGDEDTSANDIVGSFSRGIAAWGKGQEDFAMEGE